MTKPEFFGGTSVYSGLRYESPKTAYTGDGSVSYFFNSTGTKLRAHIGSGYRAPAAFERFGSSFFNGVFSPFGDPRAESLDGFAGAVFEPWAHWDGVWFVRIAADGYGAHPDSQAFFPLYPLLVRAASVLTGDLVVAGVLVSLGCYALAMILLYRLVRDDFDERAALWSVVFISVFPTALVFQAVYSESLFLFLALASFVSARNGRFGRAGLLGGLASMTRLTGWCLALPLAWEAYVRWRPTGDADPAEGARFDRRALLRALAYSAIPVLATPPGPFLVYAAAIKEVVDVPVVAVAKLDAPDLAAAALADGKCDLIALGRQMICDPEWANKVKQRQLEKIRHCKYCMTCHTAQQRGEPIWCAQDKNPDAATEKE